jgi:diguanylate cyclase (GGDEF)-like protein/PAS domain S-box-containing protein
VTEETLDPDSAGRSATLDGNSKLRRSTDTTRLKHSEQALRTSEERYRLLFESIDEGFCIIEKMGGEGGEPLDYRYIEVNPAVAVQSGLSVVPGQTLRQVIPDEFEEWLLTFDMLLKTGESIRFERGLASQGRVLELYAFRIEDHTHRRIGVSFRDITERRRTEDQLRSNHDTFFDLIQNTPFGMYVVDAQFCLRQISMATQKVFSQISPLIGRDFDEIVHLLWVEPFASEVIAHFRHTLATGEPYAAPNTTEQRNDIPDVESYDWKIERITLPDGQFGVVCYFQDITERKQTEDALRESEAFNRSIIDSSPDCIKVLDLEGNLLSMLSGQALLGIDNIQPYLNMPWVDFWEDEHREAAQKAVETGIDGVGNFVGLFRAPRGEPKWWDVSISPIRGASGQPERLLAVSRDVTHRKQAEDALRESEARYRNLFNSIDAGFCIIEMIYDAHAKPVDYRFLEVNPSFDRHTGMSDVTFKRMRELAPDHEAHWFEMYGEVARTGEPVRFVNSAEALGGRWFDVYAFRIGASDSQKVAILFTDITERKRAEAALRASIRELRETESALRTAQAALSQEKAALAAHVLQLQEANENLIAATLEAHTLAQEIEKARTRMAHLAQHDALTDLPNRILLDDRLTQAISLAQRHDKQFALMFLDLDRFKIINDSLGHAVGDQLLQSVAKRLTAVVRSSDTVCRLGGDEFVILLADIEHAQDAAQTAQKILDALTAPHRIDQFALQITVSIGISLYPQDGLNADVLIKNADSAMYQAKAAGRDNYQFFGEAGISCPTRPDDTAQDAEYPSPRAHRSKP